MSNISLPSKSFFKLIFGLVVVVITFKTCYSQKQVLITPNTSIAPLPPIAKHYQSLEELDASPTDARKEMDKIHFPDKKYQLLIRLFNPAYMTRAQIHDLAYQMKPPANSSEQTQAELDFLLQLQNTRTPEQEKLALDWNKIVYVPIIGMNGNDDLFFEGQQVLGSECTAKNYPATKKLLNNIMKEMRIMEFTAKNHFLRARPRQLSKELKPLVKMNTSSFASGHTLWAYLQAYIWAELIPDKRTSFLDLAYEIGYSREILGVHYPSDEEAARRLAHQILEVMWQTERFQKHFKKAKAEWN